MYEYSVGMCSVCRTMVLKDESYYKLGETILEGIICEECNDIVDKFNKVDFGQKLRLE